MIAAEIHFEIKKKGREFILNIRERNLKNT